MDKIMTSNVLPTQTNVIKVSRLGRRRSRNHQHYHQSKIKTQSNTIIHANIRLTNNKSTNRHENLHVISAGNDKMHYYQDDVQKSRNNRIFQQSLENSLASSNQHFIKVNDLTKNTQRYVNLSTKSHHMQNHSQSIIVKINKYRSNSSKVTDLNVRIYFTFSRKMKNYSYIELY